MASVTSEAQGAASAAQNVAGSDLLPQAGQLLNTTSPVFAQYLQELQGLTSTDPTMRMEAIAPIVAQQTALAQGEKQQVSNLPRGGEKAYLDATIDQNTATAIGNALSAEFNSAIAAEGQAGEFGIGEALSAETAAGSLFTNASGALSNVAGVKAQSQQGIEGLIAGLAGAAASAYGAYTSG